MKILHVTSDYRHTKVHKSLVQSLDNIGEEQSAIWMNLLSVDKSLYELYLAYYNKSKYEIDDRNLNSQFYSN